MTNYDLIRKMSVEEMALIIICPNDISTAEIECDGCGDRNYYQCCLDWLKSEVTP